MVAEIVERVGPCRVAGQQKTCGRLASASQSITDGPGLCAGSPTPPPFLDGLLGKPEPLKFGDKPVALIEYRDGTLIDAVYNCA